MLNMDTFQEYQAIAANVPAAPRNNRDRILLPVSGLQQEAGKIGLLLSGPSSSGQFRLTQEQSSEVKDRLADILWYVALLCGETGITIHDVAEHSAAQLHSRANRLDPERR